MSNQYYDGVKLLSTKDLYGNTPELFLCTTNKTGGKTTYFSRLCVNHSEYIKKGAGKFMLVYRFNYELDDCADKFFKDISSLFFDGAVMESRRKAAGSYCELFIDDISVGYAVALNNVDILKKYSHFFSDTNRMMFDEFQSESNHYCANEVRKFQALHDLVARGQGKQTRYVPVYMLSNPVTILNPYYVALGISSRLDDKTKFLKGDGWVLEQGYVESAANAMHESGFHRAFAGSEYNAYAEQAVYLNDNKTFVEKPNGKCRYVATLKYMGCEYAIREYPEAGVIYCDDRVDKTFTNKIAVTTDDHNINYVMLKANDLFLSSLRYFFEKGCFRFKDLRCKEAVLSALSY